MSTLFKKIINREIPADIVYEDELSLAFKDINPQAPIHILIIPKGDYISFDDFVTKASIDEVSNFFQTVKKIAHQLGVSDSGYRLVTNHGRDASQTVFHFHIHLIAGRPLGGVVPGDKNVR